MGSEPRYRVYVIGDGGRIFSGADIVCSNDEAAIAQAKQMVDGHVCELWDGVRKIAVFEPKSKAASVSALVAQANPPGS